MKTYMIEYETCLCEEFGEQWGRTYVTAESEEEARNKFNGFHAVINDVYELEDN